MTNITEHNGEKEREGNDGKQSGVDFLIGGNAICIHDFLERYRELVSAMERWRSFRSRDLVQNWRHRSPSRFLQKVQREPLEVGRDMGSAVAYCCTAQGDLDLRNVPSGHPTFRKQRLLTWVILEQVKR